uniref:Aromatic-L-amino-acid decarboxylase n=1 Tax=Pelusios castaneus TaxID=367368 RepID=A0A8C8R9W0_9SAUR
MDITEFQKRGKEMVDYIADYFKQLEKRPVYPDVEPGYLRPLIPDSAPQEPENFEDVLKDFERIIMPGVTHWHSPYFFAYFPTVGSFPALLADILSGGIGCLSFSWAASPACTELETVMLDWLGKMLNLPEEFLAGRDGEGGGVIQFCATLGTTPCCSFDRLLELGPICKSLSYYHKIFRYGIPLTRRFRSLKMWFVFRMYGIKGLQEHIRKASNQLNEALLKSINEARKIHLVPCHLREKFVLRFAICSRTVESVHVQFAWKHISKLATDLLKEC